MASFYDLPCSLFYGHPVISTLYDMRKGTSAHDMSISYYEHLFITSQTILVQEESDLVECEVV
jgi:hypothetical protein